MLLSHFMEKGVKEGKWRHCGHMDNFQHRMESQERRSRWLKNFISSKIKSSLVVLCFDARQFFSNFYWAPSVCSVRMCEPNRLLPWWSVHFANFCVPTMVSEVPGVEWRLRKLHQSFINLPANVLLYSLWSFFQQDNRTFSTWLHKQNRFFHNLIWGMECYSGQCWLEWQMICIIV